LDVESILKSIINTRKEVVQNITNGMIVGGAKEAPMLRKRHKMLGTLK
jgi:hypothetical protein